MIKNDILKTVDVVCVYLMFSSLIPVLLFLEILVENRSLFYIKSIRHSPDDFSKSEVLMRLKQFGK